VPGVIISLSKVRFSGGFILKIEVSIEAKINMQISRRLYCQIKEVNNMFRCIILLKKLQDLCILD